MKSKNSFDDYAEQYNRLMEENLGGLSSDTRIFSEYKIKLLARLLGNKPSCVLEFGCGIGRNLPFVAEYFPDSRIYACDNSSLSLKIAASEFPSGNYFLSESTDMFIAEAPEYDLCFLAGVMHHIPPPERQSWLQAIYKKMSKGGRVFIFDHNPYNPIVRRLVSTCPFDEDASLLSRSQALSLLKASGFTPGQSAYTLFFPWRKQFFEAVEKAVFWLPLGGQYYASGVKV